MLVAVSCCSRNTILTCIVRHSMGILNARGMRQFILFLSIADKRHQEIIYLKTSVSSSYFIL